MTNMTIKLTSESTAVASKTFMKNAMIYGTEEYRILRSFKAENPGVVVSAKAIKKNPNKDSYKNLTYGNMIAYINELDNASELLKEFDRQKKMAVIAKNPYRYVLNWFKSACFDNEHEFVEFRKAISLVDETEASELALA